MCRNIFCIRFDKKINIKKILTIRFSFIKWSITICLRFKKLHYLLSSPPHQHWPVKDNAHVTPVTSQTGCIERGKFTLQYSFELAGGAAWCRYVASSRLEQRYFCLPAARSLPWPVPGSTTTSKPCPFRIHPHSCSTVTQCLERLFVSIHLFLNNN